MKFPTWTNLDKSGQKNFSGQFLVKSTSYQQLRQPEEFKTKKSPCQDLNKKISLDQKVTKFNFTRPFCDLILNLYFWKQNDFPKQEVNNFEKFPKRNIGIQSIVFSSGTCLKSYLRSFKLYPTCLKLENFQLFLNTVKSSKVVFKKLICLTVEKKNQNKPLKVQAFWK